MSDETALTAEEETDFRWMVDNAVGVPFLPPAWSAIADQLPRLLATLDAARDSAGAGPDYEEMRKERGWPTPNHMRSVADALDTLTPARYGDVLRWFADLCDAHLAAHPVAKL